MRSPCCNKVRAAGETEKNWPLGTQAAPVCEVGVFPLYPPLDSSIGLSFFQSCSPASPISSSFG
jgi:hypothetical protein